MNLDLFKREVVVKARRAIAIFGTLALLLAGCATVTPAEEAVSQDVPAALKPFYTQSINWKDCGKDLKCATIRVPIDYSKPSSGSINLSLNYLASTGNADLGWLLENPGGPGGSGIDFVASASAQVGSEALRKRYNILGFDPRGVGRSAPIKCLSPKDTDDFLYGTTPGDPGSSDEIKAQRKGMKKFIDACVKNSGRIFGFVDTVSAARDMDVIRAVLGESKLNYMGFSYGTFLGTTYASVFPQRVGRFVLDGAIDPTVSDEDQSANQLKAFDQALRNYLQDCLTAKRDECPFTGSVDSAMKRITAWYKQLETRPITTTMSGRKLTISGGITGLIMTLYSEDYWQYTTRAFAEGFRGDGTMFLQLADFYNDRKSDGTYGSNQLEANLAVSCLDSRSNPSPKAMKAQNAKLQKLSPFFGRYWLNGALGCEQWPYKVAAKPKSYAAKGSAPILVVGTTGDPATPYWQAQNLANKILDNAQVVTYNGEGHTAYGRSNECIVSTVDRYLIEGSVPKSDPNC
jgi:pimeloyl-ACP methyl ester carboxylesterase